MPRGSFLGEVHLDEAEVRVFHRFMRVYAAVCIYLYLYDCMCFNHPVLRRVVVTGN